MTPQGHPGTVPAVPPGGSQSLVGQDKLTCVPRAISWREGHMQGPGDGQVELGPGALSLLEGHTEGPGEGQADLGPWGLVPPGGPHGGSRGWTG